MPESVLLPVDQQVAQQFSSFVEEAAKWKQKAEAIVVTDESQTDLIKEAKQLRITLKNIRVGVEKTRASLKEDSLRYGQQVDKVAKEIKGYIEPLEDHLAIQETFAERKEKERQDALRTKRQGMMAELDSTMQSVDLGTISEDDFSIIYRSAQQMKEERIAAEKRLEEEKAARAKAEAEERERTKVENERLRREKEEQDRVLSEERAKAAAERKVLEDQLKEERMKAAELQREEQMRIREAKAIEDASIRAQLNQGDSDKLRTYASMVRGINPPPCVSEEGRAIMNRVSAALSRMALNIEAEADKL